MCTRLLIDITHSVCQFWGRKTILKLSLPGKWFVNLETHIITVTICKLWSVEMLTMTKSLRVSAIHSLPSLLTVRTQHWSCLRTVKNQSSLHPWSTLEMMMWKTDMSDYSNKCLVRTPRYSRTCCWCSACSAIRTKSSRKSSRTNTPTNTTSTAQFGKMSLHSHSRLTTSLRKILDCSDGMVLQKIVELGISLGIACQAPMISQGRFGIGNSDKQEILSIKKCLRYLKIPMILSNKLHKI